MKYEIYIKQKDKPEQYWLSAIDEYKKRLGAYCKIRYRFVRKDKEFKKIADMPRDKNDLLIRIVTGPADFTSEQFARMIGDREGEGVKYLRFLIDPENSEGNEEIAADLTLALSPFDMPGAEAAMVLVEQIYRGYRILHHQPYHK